MLEEHVVIFEILYWGARGAEGAKGTRGANEGARGAKGAEGTRGAEGARGAHWINLLDIFNNRFSHFEFWGARGAIYPCEILSMKFCDMQLDLITPFVIVILADGAVYVLVFSHNVIK